MSISRRRIILVSNRLPVTITKDIGSFKVDPSSGGLVTGLSSLKDEWEVKWVGNPGISKDNLTKKEIDALESDLRDKNLYPVFLSSKENKAYYDGFSNNTIWPLFHYFPMFTNFDNEEWEQYRVVNRHFAEKVISIAGPDDLIWIHDYHLFLMPSILRESLKNNKIGFFLHIPFPSYEVFRLLPYRKQLLEGIMGSDLIGFHTYSYYRHFLSSTLRILGFDNSYGYFNNIRRTQVEVFPMGIDFKKYNNVNLPEITKQIEELNDHLRDKKIILSIDRLDYTKGIINRLEAFKKFLNKYPQYHEKIVFIMVSVPSRTSIKSYDKLKNQVDKLIGEINGAYSTISWTPIMYFYKSIPFDHLLALYHRADIALLTPLRDGMNLVAKEYIASKTDNGGVLILSEMAGVAEELGEAIIINPNDIDEIADSIYSALETDINEQRHKIKLMQQRLIKYDIFKWSNDFIETLTERKEIKKSVEPQKITAVNEMELLNSYIEAKKPVVILDYDGTLVEFNKDPERALPDKELYSIIHKLSMQTDLFIVSGRERDFLEKVFKGYKLGMVSEHGIWFKRDCNDEWHKMYSSDDSWKSMIKSILELYTDRTPGTFTEEKEHSIVWHYRSADPDFARLRANELKSDLYEIIANLNLGIMEGNKILEVKPLDINKGKALTNILNRDNYDFVLTIGDDTTDEYMFKETPLSGYSVKVGFENTAARYRIKNVDEVIKLLKLLER